MVVDASYPNDIRVRKEAESLSDNGKKVVVICPRKKNEPKIERVNGVDIFRIGINYSNTKKGLFDIFESFFNINPLFFFGIKKAIKKYDIAFLHVHDLPLAGTGYMFKSKVKRIILDLHENYPEALKTWFVWKKNLIIRFKNFLFMNPVIWTKKEKKYCLKYDKVICVVEEMKHKLVSKFTIAPDKFIVVSNQEKKEFASNFEKSREQKIISSNVFSITYVGGLGPHRGLDTAIKAMPLILDKIPEAKLFIVGKGSKNVEDKLQEIAKQFNIESKVSFIGYRPFDEVPAIMMNSDVNIIPHKSNGHTDNTIPHKLFQIMMSRSFLLVSSCKPLKRIVEKYNCGVVFKADDEQSFADKVVLLFNEKEKFQEKKVNGYNAVAMKGENWEEESIKLIDLYNNL